MAGAKGIKMGEGHVSVGLDRDPLDKGLEEAKSMFQEWGAGVAAVGASMTALGGLIAAPFLYGLSVLNEWGDETQRVMRQTGMSFAEVDLLLDGLRGNMLEGVSGQTVVAGMATMNKFILAAADGAQNATAALAQMGLSVEGLRGMSDSDRLLAFADGLQRIEDTGRRSAIAMEIFGRRNVFAMNLTGGSEGIRARSARVEDLQGSSMHSTEALNASRAVIAANNEMKLATQGFWASLGLAAAPVMRDFYQLMTRIIVAVRQWTEDNRPLLTMIFYIADKMILAGTVIGVLGSSIYAASYAFTFMQGVIAIVGGVTSWFIALASGGFGALKLLTMAWGVTTFSASMIATAALGVYKIGLMTLAATSWAWNAAGVAMSFVLGLFTGSTAVATVATNGYTLALVAAWIWENLVSAGIWLLITALGALVLAVGAVVIAFGGFLAFGVAMYLIYDALPQIIAYFDELLGAVADTSAWQGLVSTIQSVMAVGTQAFQGLKDAFNAGEWGLMWDILRASGLLAFEHISSYAMGIFYTVSDTIEDTFTDTWLSVKTLFFAAWGEIQRLAFTGLAAMARALADVVPDRDYADALGGYARIFDAQARGAELDARINIRNAIRDADQETAVTQAARLLRDAERGGADAERIRQLQAELDDATMYANFLAEATAGAADLPGGGRPQEGGGTAAIGSSSAGSFSRFAAAFFEGVSSSEISETPAERAAREQRNMLIAEMVENRRRLERLRGVVMG